MSGGGDTPKKTFDFACSITPDNTKFMLGKYNQGYIGVQVSEDLDYGLIVVSSEGVFIETQETDDERLSDIIAKNVGKVESLEYDVVSGLNIGDDIPEFEKYVKYLWRQ